MLTAGPPFVRGAQDSSKVGEVAVFETRYGGHATEIAREHVWRFSAIVSIGGDGTLHEIVNGLMLGYLADTSRVIPPLCIVPCGSGNTVAYDFNIVDKNDSLDALFGGVARAIDVVEITDPDDPTRRVYRNMADDAAEGGGGGGGGAAEEKGDDGAAAAEAKTEDDDGGAFKDPIFSLNIVGFGLPVTVMDTANDLRWMGGAMYNCAAYLSLIKNRSYQCTVEFPNGEPEGWNPQTINPTVMFQAQNSCHMGEKMPYCPRAKVRARPPPRPAAAAPRRRAAPTRRLHSCVAAGGRRPHGHRQHPARWPRHADQSHGGRQGWQARRELRRRRVLRADGRVRPPPGWQPGGRQQHQRRRRGHRLLAVPRPLHPARRARLRPR